MFSTLRQKNKYVFLYICALSCFETKIASEQESSAPLQNDHSLSEDNFGSKGSPVRGPVRLKVANNSAQRYSDMSASWGVDILEDLSDDSESDDDASMGTLDYDDGYDMDEDSDHDFD